MAESRYVPREYFADPSECCRVVSAELRGDISSDEFGQVVMTLMQHGAACVVRELRDQGRITFRALGAPRGRSDSTMSDYMTGLIPADMLELLAWVRELGDPSILPDLDEAIRKAFDATT